MKSHVLPLLLAAASPAIGADTREIELRRLFDPSAAEKQAEQRGRVYIYEGLRDSDVKRAMKEEFDRIDSMMFIREQITDEHGEVKREPETGEPIYQDDGC